jgi:transposase-like protein
MVAAPSQASARGKLWNAIWYRGFKRGTRCETCRAKNNIHAHHDDYTKPLDVRWLCASCHKRHHIALRRATGTWNKPGPKAKRVPA